MFGYLQIASTVSFNQPKYTVVESHQHIQPVLVLSKPLSFDFTIQIMDFDTIATSKFCAITTYVTVSSMLTYNFYSIWKLKNHIRV